MSDPNPIRNPAWLGRTRDTTAAKLTGMESLGLSVTGPIYWTDEDGIKLSATVHGEAVTVELVDSTEPIKRWDFYLDWLQPAQ